MYTFQNHLANDLETWECVMRRGGKCAAKVKLYPLGNFIESVNERNHPPLQTQCEVAKVNAGMKRQAQQTHTTLLSKFSEIKCEMLVKVILCCTY